MPLYYQQPYQTIQQPLQQPVQPIQQPIQPAIQQPVQQPIQNGGYVIVQSEDEIRRYPVAHGNIVTFRIENQPIIVEKSMGYSQFDTPHYERYRLEKEDMPTSDEVKVEYALKTDIDTLTNDFKGQIEKVTNDFKEQIEALKNDINITERKPRKKEVEQ